MSPTHWQSGCTNSLAGLIRPLHLGSTSAPRLALEEWEEDPLGEELVTLPSACAVADLLVQGNLASEGSPLPSPPRRRLRFYLCLRMISDQ